MKKVLFGAIAIALFSFSGFAKSAKQENTCNSKSITKTEISNQELPSQKVVEDLCTRTITVTGADYSYDVSVSGPCSQIDKIVDKAKKILAAT
jgi:hypothetical protein